MEDTCILCSSAQIFYELDDSSSDLPVNPYRLLYVTPCKQPYQFHTNLLQLVLRDVILSNFCTTPSLAFSILLPSIDEPSDYLFVLRRGMDENFVLRSYLTTQYEL